MTGSAGAAAGPGTGPEPGARSGPATRAVDVPLAGTLLSRTGVVVTEVAPDRAVGTMPVAGNTQPLGALHGGASVVLAETLGSVAAQAHAGTGRIAVGVDVSATHHRAVRSGTVTGVAVALHLGRTVASYEIAITDEAGRRICTARLTCQLLERPADPPGPDAVGRGVAGT